MNESKEGGKEEKGEKKTISKSSELVIFSLSFQSNAQKTI